LGHARQALSLFLPPDLGTLEHQGLGRWRLSLPPVSPLENGGSPVGYLFSSSPLFFLCLSDPYTSPHPSFSFPGLGLPPQDRSVSAWFLTCSNEPLFPSCVKRSDNFPHVPSAPGDVDLIVEGCAFSQGPRMLASPSGRPEMFSFVGGACCGLDSKPAFFAI